MYSIQAKMMIFMAFDIFVKLYFMGWIRCIIENISYVAQNVAILITRWSLTLKFIHNCIQVYEHV